jgi:hypothetical protein
MLFGRCDAGKVVFSVGIMLLCKQLFGGADYAGISDSGGAFAA